MSIHFIVVKLRASEHSLDKRKEVGATPTATTLYIGHSRSGGFDSKSISGGCNFLALCHGVRSSDRGALKMHSSLRCDHAGLHHFIAGSTRCAGLS